MKRYSLIYFKVLRYSLDRKPYVERVYDYPYFHPYRSANAGKLVVI